MTSFLEKERVEHLTRLIFQEANEDIHLAKEEYSSQHYTGMTSSS
jgi:hypothetical protein